MPLSGAVGLGKTNEAGILIKEYRLRGLLRNALILTLPALVSQGQEELLSKFDLPFATTEDVEVNATPN